MLDFECSEVLNAVKEPSFEKQSHTVGQGKTVPLMEATSLTRNLSHLQVEPAGEVRNLRSRRICDIWPVLRSIPNPVGLRSV